jgi:hypothetical protein
MTSLLSLKHEVELLYKALSTQTPKTVTHLIFFVSPTTGERLLNTPTWKVKA